MIDLQKEYNNCWNVFSVHFPHLAKPKLLIIKLKKTWGICGGIYISLNKKLENVKDADFVRHVIYHEMCHLIFHHHHKEFYDLLKQFDPLQLKENQKLTKRIEAFQAIAEQAKPVENGRYTEENR